jgi:hypothetical protein
MIAEARNALEALLSATGLHVYDNVPERAALPCAILEPSGASWIASGEAYGEYRVGFDVTVAVQTASNKAMTDNLDTFVEELLIAVHDAPGFYLSEIAAPGGVDINGVVYLGTTFTVYQNARL